MPVCYYIQHSIYELVYNNNSVLLISCVVHFTNHCCRIGLDPGPVLIHQRVGRCFDRVKLARVVGSRHQQVVVVVVVVVVLPSVQ